MTLFIINQLPLLTQGLLMTLALWLCSALIGFAGGIALSLALLFVKNKVMLKVIHFFVFIMRAVPVYVLVLITYFVLPDLLGINLSAFSSAVCALGLCSSTYTAEIIRSGVHSIARGQWEAAKTLGLSNYETMRFVIAPQVVKIILPALGNELESLLKSTAILSVVGVTELTKIGNNIIAQSMKPVPIYLTIAMLYALISFGLNRTLYYAEKNW